MRAFFLKLMENVGLLNYFIAQAKSLNRLLYMITKYALK